MSKRLSILSAIFFGGLLLSVGYLDYGHSLWNSAVDWMNADTHGGSDYYRREIGTNIDLWLNGYLGIFFRFKMFGLLNWLSIPLFIYFIITLRKRERWQIAIASVLCITCLFLGFQGYQNYRYQLTVYPVLVSLIFIFGWETLKNRNWKIIVLVISISSVLLFINLYYSTNNYKYYMLSSMGRGKAGEGFPYKLIAYINDMVDEDSVIWQRKQLILFYHTDRIGSKSYNKEVKYLLTRKNQNISLKRVDYNLIIEDQGYKLYEIIDKSSVPTIAELNKNTPDFETDFSNWNGSSEIDANGITNVVFPMQILGIRGDFVVKKISLDSGNIIRLTLNNVNFNERPEIQFGYFIQSDKLNLKVDDGGKITIKAKMRLKSKQSAKLFIQDKTDYWSRESLEFNDSSWQDVIVSKKQRNGAEKICFGINWLPSTTEEWLDISSIKVFIENKIDS
jgi:hypothetical protein